jgi:hypothetical protein
MEALAGASGVCVFLKLGNLASLELVMKLLSRYLL